MFDISFAEMMVVAVVALLVIGPEKLPKVARDVGKFVSRAKLYFHSMKTDMSREIRMEELLKMQERIQQQYNLAQDAIINTSQSVDSQVQQISEATVQTIQSTEPQSVTNLISEITPPKEVATDVVTAPKLESRKPRRVASPKNTPPDSGEAPTVENLQPDELPQKKLPLD
ncbi:MAG: Sec-independent protein translocase protein TatB [Candidatus Nitrotoga sp.]